MATLISPERKMFRTLADNVHPLLSASSDAVVICDAAEKIHFWNARATELFGWAQGDAIGQTLDIILPQVPRAPERPVSCSD